MIELFKVLFFFILENVFYFLKIPTGRQKEIEKIIADLERLRTTRPEYALAIDLNIEFTRATVNAVRYFRWLKERAMVIRERYRGQLLELADLPLPEWQRKTHKLLSILERKLKPIPDLLKPIREKVFNEIVSLREKEGSIRLLNLGCGAMELEKQIIEKLLKAGFVSKDPVIFMGVDRSAEALSLIETNLAPLLARGLVKIQRVSRLMLDVLDDLGRGSKAPFILIILNSDIFSLKNLPENWVDLVYHSRLKHHFNQAWQKKELDRIAIRLASTTVVEFDDFCDKSVFPFPSILTWRWVCTLNGAILSYLRDPTLEELLKRPVQPWELWYHKTFGYYLRTYRKVKTAREKPCSPVKRELIHV